MCKKYILIIILINFLLPIIIFAEDERIKIQGEYSLTIDKNINPLEMKYICYNKTLIEVFKSLSVFSSESAGMDENVIKDLAYILSSGYLEDLKIVEEERDGNIYCHIEAYINPIEFRNILGKEVYRARHAERGFVNGNALLKILAVIPRGENIELVIKLVREGAGLMEFNSLGKVLFDGKTLSTITVEYFTAKGEKMKEEKKSVGVNMKVGEIKSIFFTKPAGIKYCRIKLPEKEYYTSYR